MSSIEAARAVAAVVVVLMHAANLMRVEHFSGHVGLSNIFDFGYVGVDFFFVLSGFIITYVHFSEIGQPKSLPRYLWRRFSRIYPIYWVTLLIAVAISLLGQWVSGRAVSLDIGMADVAGTVFLIMGEGEPKYVGVAWSLQYELVFYLAFCLLLANARLGLAVFTAWGIFVLVRVFGLVEADLPLNLGNAHCLQFLSGIAVGILARRTTLDYSFLKLPVALSLLVLAIIFEVYGPFERHSAAGRLVLGFASALVLATLVALENKGLLRAPVWLSRMGAVSYSIYLGHVMIVNLTYAVLLKLGLYHALPELLVYVIGLAAALFTTALIGFYIELPLVHALKDRWGSNRSRRGAGTVEEA